jgi:MFS family permease
MALMFVFKRYETPSQISAKNTNIDQNSNPTKTSIKLFDEKGSPRKLFIILISILLSTFNAAEVTFYNFGPTFYQYIPIKLSASKSAEMMSAMALSFTISRGINFFIAIKIRPQHMIAYHLLIILIANIILVFGQNSLTLLWIGTIIIGYGLGPLYAAIFAVIGHYIEMTDRIGTIFLFSSASIYLFLPFILGTFIEKYSIVFILSIAINVIISTFVFALILYIIRKTKKSSINCIHINCE